MTLIEATKTCFSKYVTFSGRASRAEFWKFILFILVVSIGLTIINSLIFGPEIVEFYHLDAAGQASDELIVRYHYNGGLIGNLFLLIVLLPWLAAGWRRMHDIGLPGYLPFLLLLVWVAAVFALVAVSMGPTEMIAALRSTGSAEVSNPKGGGIVFFVAIVIFGLNLYWLVKASQLGPNKYGYNPNEVPQ
ncbi:MAG: uncharacterized membrane protein YhaH (DUF805 family) [Paracoccaceae bacterium]|jgi:uncharacterized membrane protein YhaH (DUF805 family)